MERKEIENLRFEILDSVNNPKSIHGIYPYRGKISALDAKQILEQLPSNITLLDPFCGSGTILYEAQKLGMKTIGVDLNPIAITLSKAKTDNSINENDIIQNCNSIINSAKIIDNNWVKLMPDDAIKHFHLDTADEIMRVLLFFDDMCDYLKAAFFGAIALSARGCNDYKWTSSTVGKNIEPKRYINFYDKFIYKCKKHLYINSGNKKSEIIKHDSRRLKEIIKEKSVDVVFTSPPYFDALDYTAYYAKIIYDILGEDRLTIKEDLIQKVSTYKESMQEVLRQIEYVTKDDAIIIFVVGDKKSKGDLISGGEYFADIHYRKPLLIKEREYKGSSSQVFDKLNNTKRKEQIVVWHKQSGA
ncbi:DNA adenine methylase [Clostridium perfringens]|uniref:DNA methyltransferase n=1 Tax=Clostridium perfringens TaxID=1502 RepID=UPI001ABAF240|nr:DNA methyltransferase [Clostridium perfringens]MBO3323109.1 DNA adenine methylase [Clostridium perfringens]MBO3332273.1 DNA adenine methylase [Clostridium perfringens]MCX0372718.1 DNA adenine methylase [Clostridium perfringens]